MATELTDSILKTIKKMIGPSEDYDYFDTDLIIHINTAMSLLIQRGMPAFSITGETETWNDYIQGRVDLNMIKSYIYFKVKIAFDPPQSSFVLESYKKQADELEWRLEAVVDPSEIGAPVSSTSDGDDD